MKHYLIQQWYGQQLGDQLIVKSSWAAAHLAQRWAQGWKPTTEGDGKLWPTIRIMEREGEDYCEVWEHGKPIRCGTFAQTTLVREREGA